MSDKLAIVGLEGSPMSPIRRLKRDRFEPRDAKQSPARLQLFRSIHARPANSPLCTRGKPEPPMPPPWLRADEYAKVYPARVKPLKWTGHIVIPLDFDPLSQLGEFHLEPSSPMEEIQLALSKKGDEMVLQPIQRNADRLQASRLRLTMSSLCVPQRREIICRPRSSTVGRIALLVNTRNLTDNKRTDLASDESSTLGMADDLDVRTARDWNDLWNIADSTLDHVQTIAESLSDFWLQYLDLATPHLSPRARHTLTATTTTFIRPLRHFLDGPHDVPLLDSMARVWQTLLHARRMCAELSAVVDLLYVLTFGNRGHESTDWIRGLGEDAMMQVPVILASVKRKVPELRNLVVVWACLVEDVQGTTDRELRSEDSSDRSEVESVPELSWFNGDSELSGSVLDTQTSRSSSPPRSEIDMEADEVSRWDKIREFAALTRWTPQDTTGYQEAIRWALTVLERNQKLAEEDPEAWDDLKTLLNKLQRAKGKWPADGSEFWEECPYFKGQRFGMVWLKEMWGTRREVQVLEELEVV